MTPATPEDVQPRPHPSTQLSDVVHPRARLGILTVLAEVDTATFAYLKTALQLTDGNLGRHLETLAAEQLVTIKKGYEGRRPRTWITITDHGRAQIASEVAVLKALVTQYEKSSPANQPDCPVPGDA
jgi:DNA-binding MarR family transcriptional regulator